MASKRQRPPGISATNRAHLSKRPKVDLNLAQVWEQLVDESEDVRLNAVYELLTNYLDNSDSENAKTIANRLFRGLCSSRKNARQGFYVALVGALSLEKSPFRTHAVSLMEMISILEIYTTAESGTSGQDERDHHFGRLLGCRALLESQTLWEAGSVFVPAWGRTLDILLKLMAQKPWIRAEGSSVVCAAVLKLATLDTLNVADLETAVAHLFQHLKYHRLLHTIDGVGIWLTVHQAMPHVKLPKNTWTTETPIHPSQLQVLKKTLLGKQLSSHEEEETEESLLGRSVWSPRLHPAWSTLLHQIDNTHRKEVNFEAFWQEVVDRGLFDPSSTPERKYTGFLVLECALEEVKSYQISHCFSKNLMACLIQSLQNPNEAYLRKMVMKIFKNFESSAREQDPGKIHNLVFGLLRGSDFADFDVLTKTKIVTSLFDIAPLHSSVLSDLLIRELVGNQETEKPLTKIATSRKNILNVFTRAFTQAIRALTGKEVNRTSSQEFPWVKLQSMLESLLNLREKARTKDPSMLTWDEGSYTTLQEKLTLMLESVLAAGYEGEQCFLAVVASLKKIELDADDAVQKSLDASWKLFEALSRNDAALTDSEKRKLATHQRGLRLLEAFLLYEACDGDATAIEMLEDVTSMAGEFSAGQGKSESADQTLEIVISFMSKPSKFRRRACTLIFEAFAAHVSTDGLKSICQILTTKESRDGQQELFENEDELVDENSDDDEDGMEPDLDASDVEIVSVNDDSVGDSSEGEISSENALSDTSSSKETGTEDAASVNEEDELARLEGALAAALGTRKFNATDIAELESDANPDTNSNSDMSDSEMMELDDKLAEVFRNQQSQVSVQKLRREEMKSAKENIVNLKNRAVDLVEVYFRSQGAKGSECVDLLTSILQMAQITSTQQLANRGIATVKSYAQKHKGLKLPKVETSALVRETLWQNVQTLLRVAFHKNSSNYLIDVAGQLNVLACKLLIVAGDKGVEKSMASLSDEHGYRQNMNRKATEAFWSRYDAWLDSTNGLTGGPVDHDQSPRQVRRKRSKTKS